MAAARAAFGLRDLDARVAELVRDSEVDAPLMAVRSTVMRDAEGRMLSYEAGGTTIECEVMTRAGQRSVSGQLSGGVAAAVEAQVPGEPPMIVPVSAHGWFTAMAGGEAHACPCFYVTGLRRAGAGHARLWMVRGRPSGATCRPGSGRDSGKERPLRLLQRDHLDQPRPRVLAVGPVLFDRRPTCAGDACRGLPAARAGHESWSSSWDWPR